YCYPIYSFKLKCRLTLRVSDVEKMARKFPENLLAIFSMSPSLQKLATKYDRAKGAEIAFVCNFP
ncbi:MAG TPA: hypothetical protein PLP72_25350, partial [Leptospiraceae bacterium]|nr:hypothetical protein [Leptospiraceae bacterium]